jgi:hypothetical protein
MMGLGQFHPFQQIIEGRLAETIFGQYHPFSIGKERELTSGEKDWDNSMFFSM